MAPTLITIDGRKRTIAEARVLLGIPADECFGCYLGDCHPATHDLPDACRVVELAVVALAALRTLIGK